MSPLGKAKCEIIGAHSGAHKRTYHRKVREPAVCARARTTDFTMTDTTPKPPLPDHLSIDPRSPHYVAEIFEHDIGIRFNGKDRHDVEEYCVSEGWVKVPAGKTLDRKGNPLMLKLKGKVEAFYKE